MSIAVAIKTADRSPGQNYLGVTLKNLAWPSWIRGRLIQKPITTARFFRMCR
jgi:hypothetical protein